MLDYAEYTIDSDGYQGNGNHRNGYAHLKGDWLTYYKVGKGFSRIDQLYVANPAG